MLDEENAWKHILRMHRANHRPQQRTARAVHGIVLAGGSSRRLRTPGSHRPKQLRTFDSGAPTLLRRAVERADRLTRGGMVRAVVGRAHTLDAASQLASMPRSRLVVEPQARGTAVALLLGLMDALLAEPHSQVVVLPADHLFEDEEVLARTVKSALAAALAHPHRMVLVAAEPTGAKSEHGWILPCGVLDDGADPVGCFVRRPDAERAARLVAQGGAWLTPMCVGTGRALLGLLHRQMPLAVRLLADHACLPPEARERFLQHTYEHVAPADLCDDVLPHDPHLSMVTLPRAAGLHDLDTEAQIHAWRSAGRSAREAREPERAAAK